MSHIKRRKIIARSFWHFPRNTHHRKEKKSKQNRTLRKQTRWPKRRNVWIYFASHFMSNKNKNKKKYMRRCDLTWRLELSFFSFHRMIIVHWRYSSFGCDNQNICSLVLVLLLSSIRVYEFACTCACLDYKRSFILDSFALAPESVYVRACMSQETR